MSFKDKITGPLKRVLKASVMGKLFATPDEEGSAGVRSVVGESVATNLTPQLLHSILEEAKSGDPSRFLELAEEMEERDGHYGSVLSTRKLTLAGIPGEIQAASDDPRDKEIAEAVRQDILNHPEFPLLIRNLTAALGRSFAVCETTWDTSNPTRWKPKKWDWVDPRWFIFDKETKRRLLLKDKDHKDGLELPERKYVIHYANLKPGLPIRSGLAWLSVWSWLLKSYTVKDWAKFCELFGQPLRLGKYESGANDEDKRALLRAVRSIARDAAAIIPDSMDIELIQTNAKGGDPVFAGFAEYLDKQISKAVLGQTMTSEDGSSQSQAEIHNEVRLDILGADAIDLAVTVQRDMIIPYCLTNYGALERYPTFKIDVAEEEDLELVSKIWERLHKMGLRIPEKAGYDRFNIPEPDKNEAVIEPRTAQADTSADNSPEQDPAKGTQKAANREHFHPENDDLDDLTAAALDGWRPQLGGVFDPVAKLLATNTSVEDFATSFASLLNEQDMGPLTDTLAEAGIKARAHGETDASKEAIQ